MRPLWGVEAEGDAWVPYCLVCRYRGAGQPQRTLAEAGLRQHRSSVRHRHRSLGRYDARGKRGSKLR